LIEPTSTDFVGSNGEIMLSYIFVNMNVTFKKEARLKELGALRLDFLLYITLSNGMTIVLAVEYDGEQHYKAVERFGGEEGLRRTQENDKRKNVALQSLGIPLLRIRNVKCQNRLRIIINDFIATSCDCQMLMLIDL
jgi:very-short-patch-repair endonuclease